MGKKTKKELREDRYSRLGLKWEFLRRNKNYRDDYGSYVMGCRERYGISFIPNSKLEIYVKKQAKYFRDKYGIKLPIDFNISYFELKEHIRKPLKRAIEDDWKKLKDDLHRLNEKNEYYRKKLLRKREKSLFWYSHLPNRPETPYYLNGKYKAVFLETIIRNFETYGSSVISSKEVNLSDEMLNKRIEMTIDFSAPLVRIIADIGRNIEFWYKQFNPLAKDTKLRLDNYKKLLDVYDLRKNEGWSWEKLTKKFKREKIWQKCGNVYENRGLQKNTYKYLTREVKRDFSTCKRFVDGDYSKIW